ncbi:hypothetical protein BDZ89DRAFT_1117530 [Hymenopellis radicata]|nr:hypothetical protein BDZ89DRAFT_1117530 [Hymenopellis radicata]
MSLKTPVYTPIAMSTALAKIYHTHPTSSEWKYYGHRGILVFGAENNDELSFRLFACDDAGAWKVLWAYRLPTEGRFDYHVDGLPSFHWFHGLTRKFGILFEDDDDADIFLRAVWDRTSRPESPSSTLDGRRAKGWNFASASALSLTLSLAPELPRRSTLPKRSGSRIWPLKRNRSERAKILE